MIDSDDLAVIRREIATFANVILSGLTEQTQLKDVSATEEVGNILGNDKAQLPVAHPFGFTSRSDKGTVAVTARHGAHPASRLVVAHRDVKRPLLGEAGEVMLYDRFDQQIWMKRGKMVHITEKIQIGSESPGDKMALAALCKAELNALRTALQNTQTASTVAWAALVTLLGVPFAAFLATGPVIVPPVYVPPNPINDVASAIVESD